MSITATLYSGASGLDAQGEALAVVGDNIANVNTVGFKGSRGIFDDVLGLAVQGSSGGTSQIGLGVRFGGVEQLFTQGSFQSTGKSTDVALDGGGFFMLNGNHGGVNGNYFTRSGQFHINAQGILVSADGLQVQGWGIDPTGKMSGASGPLQVAGRTQPPKASSKVSAFAALDTRAAPPPPWDTTKADSTSNFSTSLPIYDSLGNPHTAQVFYRNTGVNGTWEWHAVVDGGDIQGGTKGTPLDVAHGSLAFSNTGALSQTTTAANTFNFVGAAPGQVVNFDFGDAIAAGGSGLKGSTASAQTFTMNSLDQDGHASGNFNSLSITSDGTIEGVFTNGQHQALGRLAVASFNSETGLHREGGALWSATTASGVPNLGSASTGPRGQLVSGVLEQSNVDLTQQFVDMIALQRGFQANSKTIQTTDENYVTLTQLKR